MAIFLIRLWDFVKTNWRPFLIGIVVLVACVALKVQSESYFVRLQEVQDAHEEEIRKINEIRSEEQRQHDENLKRLQESLDAIQARYDIAKRDLDDKKKQEIVDIVNCYGSDPDELARQLSNVTGFSIVLPTE